MQLPEQSGRTVLVTGATSGLGQASARALVAAGARVLLGVRDVERGRRAVPGGEPVALDLADLAAVRRAAATVRELTGDRLDVLLSNAGITGVPYGRTVDGAETQIATNHLGPAALTWLLMPALRAAGTSDRPSRVVTVTSIAHRLPGLDVDDLDFDRRRYDPGRAYAASKRANLLFSDELDRRLRAAGDPVIAVAAHPGMTDTELFANAVRRRRGATVLVPAARLFNRLFTQRVEAGAEPQLQAATAPGIAGGTFLGPGGPGELRGRPAPARRARADAPLAARLWEVTAARTGVAPDPA